MNEELYEPQMSPIMEFMGELKETLNESLEYWAENGVPDYEIKKMEKTIINSGRIFQSYVENTEAVANRYIAEPHQPFGFRD